MAVRDTPPVPRNLIIDMETGLTLNLPAEYQLFPGWWVKRPDLYKQLCDARRAHGVTCLDFADSRFMPGADDDGEKHDGLG